MMDVSVVSRNTCHPSVTSAASGILLPIWSFFYFFYRRRSWARNLGFTAMFFHKYWLPKLHWIHCIGPSPSEVIKPLLPTSLSHSVTHYNATFNLFSIQCLVPISCESKISSFVFTCQRQLVKLARNSTSYDAPLLRPTHKCSIWHQQWSSAHNAYI